MTARWHLPYEPSAGGRHGEGVASRRALLSVCLYLQSGTATEDDARAALAQAAMAGADPQLLRDAWETYRRVRAEDVKTLETTP